MDYKQVFVDVFHGTQEKVWKLDRKSIVTVGVGYASDEKEYRCTVLDDLKPLPEEWNPTYGTGVC